MIRADCRFLQTQHLLDYSLLLGIYRPLEGLPQQQKAAELQRLARQCRGTAVVSRDRQKVRASPGSGEPPPASPRPHGRARTQVYFFGIIDVLERFSLRWRLQRMVLRLL